MTVITATLRPNQTLRSVQQTLHGTAATVDAAVADDDDSTYSHSAAGGFVKVGFPGHALPTGAVVNGVTVRLRSRATAATRITTLLNGDSTGPFPFTPNVGPFRTDTGFPLPGISTQAVANGLALQWNTAGPAEVAEAYLDIEAYPRPTVTVDEPVGAVGTSQQEVGWAFAGDFPQSQYQVKVFSQDQFDDPAFNPTTSAAFYDSGIQTGGADTFTPPASLTNGVTYRFYARAAQLVNSETQWSAWDFSEQEVDAAGPLVPTVVVEADDALARIKLTLTDTFTAPPPAGGYGHGPYGRGPYGGAHAGESAPAPTGTPATSFPFYVGTGAINITSDDVDDAIGYKAQGFRSGFMDWSAGDPHQTGVYTPKAAWDDVVAYMNEQTDFGFVCQFGLGPTFNGMGFARNAPKPGGGTVNVPVVLSQYVLSLAEYYDGNGGRPLITEFELFNEAQLGPFDNGHLSGITTGQAKGAAYLEYLARIYPALKAARPDAQIYMTGLARNTPQDFISGLIGATFTLGGHTYSLATDKLFDKAGVHTYFYFGSAEGRSGFKNLDACHDLLTAVSGYEDVEFVSTEAGYPITLDTDGNPDGVHDLAESTQGLLDLANAWQARPWAGGGGNVLCWFNYRTAGRAADRKGLDFGMLDADGADKDPLTSTFTAIIDAQYTNPPPVTTAFAPLSGTTAGGDTLTIHGSFLAGATVTVGGAACTAVSVAADGKSLTCKTPAHAATPTAPVIVTTAHGTYTASDSFQFAGSGTTVPTITSISPATGAAAGGTSVVISGANLSSVTAVKFGGTAAASFTVDSPTVGKITAVSPARPGGGNVHLTVTNPTADSTHTTADQFTYTTTPTSVTVTAVSPASGPIVGGTLVDIIGTFPGTLTAVMFGGVASPFAVQQSSTEVQALAPAQAAGLVDITVVTTSGTSGVVAADAFQYYAQPAVASISPTSGPPGTQVTINGTNFDAVDDSVPANVKFGGVACQSFTVESATKIVAIAPAGTGNAQITVTSDAGTSDTSTASRYTYAAAGPTWQFTTIQRSNDNGLTWGPVRSGTRAAVLGATFVLYDYEACNSVEVIYRAQAIAVVTAGEVASDWSDPTDPVEWTSPLTWLKSPTLPAVNTPVRIGSLPTLTRRQPQGSFDVEGRADPVVVSDTRKLPAGTVIFQALELVERDAIQLLLERSETLLLQTPPEDDFGCRYIAIGDVDETRNVDQATQRERLIICPFQEVLAPAGEIVGLGITWQTVIDRYATWSDLTELGSWEALLELTP